MAFRPIHNTILSTWTGHRGTDLRQMVHAFRVSGAAPTTADLAQLHSELIASVLPKLRAISCSDLTWESISSRWMDVPNGVELATPILANGQGTRPGSSSPGNVAYAVSWRTGQSGRSFRGRTYLTNLNEGDTNGDTIGSTLLGLIVDFALEMLISRVAARFAPSVASRALEGSTPMQTAVFEPTLDSQRRRLATRGR
jgi:hypothetical protein